ncbi:MAG: hypothetical protein WCC06_05000 [Candidatus Aminicenantales bacterium]
MLFIARLPLLLFTALAGVMIFLLVLDLVNDRRAAVLSWLAFAFTSPMIFYSQVFYPEVPVALIVLFVFRQGVQKRNFRGLSILLSGTGITLLPWFGIKYIVLSAGLVLILAAARFKSLMLNLKRIWLFLTPLFISGVLYILFLWNLYGKISPITIYRGTLDDKEYKLSFFLISGPLKAFLRCLAVFAVFLAFFSVNRFWGGHAPPGRHLISVFWILAVFLAPVFQVKNKAVALLRRIFLALSFLIVFACLQNPWLLFHENISNRASEIGLSSNLLTSLSNTFIDFRKVVPSLAHQPSVPWLTLTAWTAGIALVTAFVLKRKIPEVRKKRRFPLVPHLILVFSLSVLFLSYVFFNIHLERGAVFPSPNFQVFSRMITPTGVNSADSGQEAKAGQTF